MTPLERLIAAPEEGNPALIMAWELSERDLRGELSVEVLIPLAGEIEEAIKLGSDLQVSTRNVMSALERAKGQTLGTAPVGF